MNFNKKLCANVLIVLMIPKIIFADSFISTEREFVSELDAVIAAMDYYNPVSIRENREYMGTIYQDGEKYRFTVTPGSKINDHVEIRISKDLLNRSVALWHTHGGKNGNYRYFSKIDTKTVATVSLPFYLSDYTGYLKIFRPGDNTLTPFQARRRGLAPVSGFAAGTKVHDKDNEPVRIKTRS